MYNFRFDNSLCDAPYFYKIEIIQQERLGVGPSDPPIGDDKELKWVFTNVI